MNSKTHHYWDVLQAAVALAGALVCMVLFLIAQPVDLHRHNLLMSYVTQLQRDEALLGEEVMRLDFQIANDYDRMTAIATRLRDTTRELRAGDVASSVRKDKQFERQLQLLERRLKLKFEALEVFKSKNSILKNSFIYLPHLRDVLQKTLRPGDPVHERLDQLIELVLLQNNNASVLDRGQLDELIVTLEDDSKQLQQSKLQQEFKVLLRHARLVVNASKELHAIQMQLSNPESGEGLSEAYNHYYDKQVLDTSDHRTFLLLVMLSLLGYAALSFFHWWELNAREKSRRLKLAAAVFESQEGMVVTDANNVILRVNRAFTRITGYSAEEAIGQTPNMLKSGQQDAAFYAAMWDAINTTGAWEGEIWNRRKNGEVYPEHLTINAVKDSGGQVANYVATLTDITLRKATEDEIKRLAFYDPLTGLPNRRLLLDRLQHALLSNTRSNKKAALLFIDLDHFKSLNDTLGHDVGDLLLQQVANRLSTCMRKSDTVARFGGDEFVVMLADLSEDQSEATQQAQAVGKKILTVMNQPYQLGEHEHYSSPSIGVTLTQGTQSSTGELLKQADMAMYQSKKSGRNTLHFFDPSMLDAPAQPDTE
jgi:diguanylate cyclase (GGDEF)-like protein/PAS domain S-box-containing protein